MSPGHTSETITCSSTNKRIKSSRHGCDRRACEKARLDDAALNRPSVAVAATRRQRTDAGAPLRQPARATRRQLPLDGPLTRAHETCEEHGDFASASFIENWIDEAERRVWFLVEVSRDDGGSRGGFLPD